MPRTTSLEAASLVRGQMQTPADAFDPDLGFERLNALVRSGYAPRIGGDPIGNSIELALAG